MIEIIANPHSRSGHGREIIRRMEKLLQDRGIKYQLRLTKGTGDASLLTRQYFQSSAFKDPSSFLLIMGGDGTLNEAVNGLPLDEPSREIPSLAYLPSGSGNDFARSMGLKGSAEEGLCHLIDSPKVCPVDLGAASFPEAEADGKRRFAVSCGIGYDAAVCHQTFTDPIKPVLNRFHLGKLSYVIIGIKQIIALRPAQGTLTIWKDKDSAPETIPVRDLAFLSAHIQPFEGGGFRFAPHAVSSDGLFDLCLVTAKSRLSFAGILLLSIFGQHEKSRQVSMIRCRKFRLTIDTALPVHADGEICGCRKILEAECSRTPANLIT